MTTLRPTDTDVGVRRHCNNDNGLNILHAAGELTGPALPFQEVAVSGNHFVQTAAISGDDLAQAPTEPQRTPSLVPGDRFDMQATWDYRQAFLRDIRWLRENDRESLRGISENIVAPAAIHQAARNLDRLLRGTVTGAERTQVLEQLNQQMHEMFINCIQMARGDRTQAMVNVELLRRSLNQQLQTLGSDFQFGALDIAADRNGRLYMGLPVLRRTTTGGRETWVPTTGMIRFAPLLSRQEIQNGASAVV